MRDENGAQLSDSRSAARALSADLSLVLARAVSSVLAEISDFAKAALEANRRAGRVWIRLLISIRSTHFATLGRKSGIVSEGAPIEVHSEVLFERFENSGGKEQPWLELPPFSEEAAREVYEKRACTPPASTLPWADLPERIRSLLKQPLLIDIFHQGSQRSGGADEVSHLILIVTELDIWKQWFCSGSIRCFPRRTTIFFAALR